MPRASVPLDHAAIKWAKARVIAGRGLVILAMLGMLAVDVPPARSSVLPPGFEETTMVAGLVEPTTVAWTPDGRMFIAERAGRVLVQKADGQMAAAPLLDFTATMGRQGLAGLAVDRDFSTNRYLYLGYTTANALGRVTRVVVRPDNTLENPTAPETILLGTATTSPCPAPSNTSDCFDADGEHTINSVVSDPRDGTLWITSGDGTVGTGVQSEAFRAYDEQSYAGKLLHVDRDGRGLPGHPFCPTDSDLTHVCTRIYAKGFRNPFRMSFRPDGRPLVGDVGFVTREELDLVAPGRDYGWPCYEGTIQTPGYKDDSRCPPEYAKAGTAAAAAPPVYDYAHTGPGGAIVAGPTYGPGDYPADYDGDIFFGDYVHGTVQRLRLSATDQVTSVTSFATSWGAGVDLKLSPDGDLVSVDYAGAVRRIHYTAGNHNPVARPTATPSYGPAPLVVQFDGTASSDVDGQALNYEWDFDDGSPASTEASPSHTYADGTRDFVARLTVTDGAGGSGTATVTVTPGNSPPHITLTAPATYRAGQSVALTATATDDEDGDLLPTSFQWSAQIIHVDHIHPGAGAAGTAAMTFTATTDHDADSHYDVTLTVTDSRGLRASRTVTIQPETRLLTVSASPLGSTVTYNGVERTAPLSKQATVGFRTSVSVPQTFELAGQVYDWASWSDGGARLHDITVPDQDSALLATYRAAAVTRLEAESMTLPSTSNTVTVLSSAAASGGKAVRIWRNASLTKTSTLPATSSLLVRAASDLCNGGARMVVRVDGIQVLATIVPGTGFADFPAALSLPSGQHSVEVAFTNDYYGGTGCDRNLIVDKVTFVTAPPAADTTPPAAPTGLRATAGSATVALDWADNTEADLAGYDVYRGTISGGPYTKVNANLVTTSAYADNGLVNGTTYYYVTRALDRVPNTSAPSAQAQATPTVAPPSTSTYIEAESMTLPTTAGTVTVYSSSLASAGKAVRIWRNATLSKTLTLPASSWVEVRALGEQCSGAPNVVVRVDGVQALTALVPATTFSYYHANVAVPAGQHTVTASFTNDYYGGTGCDRNLHLDKVIFHP